MCRRCDSVYVPSGGPRTSNRFRCIARVGNGTMARVERGLRVSKCLRGGVGGVVFTSLLLTYLSIPRTGHPWVVRVAGILREALLMRMYVNFPYPASLCSTYLDRRLFSLTFLVVYFSRGWWLLYSLCCGATTSRGYASCVSKESKDEDF